MSPTTRRQLASVTTATLLIAGTSFARQAAPSADDPKFEQLAALVTQKMTEYRVPGVAFGILKNGRITMRGFGTTNLDNPQPVTPETVFPIASISKTVTATAMLRLVEQGRLDLSSPIRQYLPGFAVKDPVATQEVATWHLLTHTAGWEGQLTPEDRGVQSLAQFAESQGELPQLAPPGEVWSYNNAGFTIAGRVIEVVTGQRIHDAIASLVLQPIGLTRTFTRTEDAVTYPFAAAHRSQGDSLNVVRPISRSSTVTAGGVWMTLSDMLTYAKFHLGDGSGADGKPVLKRASLELMRTPRVKKVGTDDEMGLGWHLRKIGGVMTASHGGTLGHISLLELVPDRQMALAILTNHNNGWRLIQDVERTALTVLEGMRLDPARTIGHRGLNETMPEAPVMPRQPDPAPYLGIYRRPPLQNTNTVAVDNGQITLDGSAIGFYAADRAIVSAGNSRGNPVEFIRRPDGAVGWIRVVGRIARKE
jgi:CubicO group peptidase (beta-lactamase class C family)